MAKNAFGDEIVETGPAKGVQQPSEAPSFRQRLAVNLTHGDPESQVATAKGFGFDARMATPAEEHPPITNQYVPEQNQQALRGLLYKDSSGKWQQFFPKDDYSKLAAHGIRDTAVAGGATFGGLLGFGAPIPGGALIGAGGGAMAGDAATDAFAGVLGARDVRPLAANLLGRAFIGLWGAAGEGGGQIVGQQVKKTMGNLAAGTKSTLRPDPEGILSRMASQDIPASRGAIFTSPKEIAEEAVAKKTSDMVASIDSIPTTKTTPEQVGLAVRESAKSKAGFDPLTKTVESAGPYFEGAGRAYEAGISQVRGQGPTGNSVDLPNTFKALQSTLSAWKETPNIGKQVSGGNALASFKDLVKSNGKMSFDNLKDWHTALGKEMNNTLVRGEQIPDHIISVFKAQQEDLANYAAANGTKQALENANAIWKTSTQEAGLVGPIARARSGKQAAQIAAEDLSPEAISLIQNITSPDTFAGFQQNTLRQLMTKVGDRSTPTRPDLDKFFTEIKKLDPKSLDLLVPPTLPGALGRPAGTVPNPRRVELDAAIKSAEETGFFGMDALSKKTEMNPIIQTLKDAKSATARWLYMDKMSDMPFMLRWFASANSIRNDATSRLLSFAGNVPNATVRDELVKKILAKPIDAKEKGE